VLVVQDYDTAGMDTLPRLACWEEFSRVMDGVFEQAVLPVTLRLGITTRESADACLAELTAAAGDRTNFVRLPTLVGVYKRKP
jgi:hypothetical protein